MVDRTTRNGAGGSRTGTRKGFLFSIDALLAALLIIGGVSLIMPYLSSQPEQTQTAYLSQDVMAALNTISIKELNNTWVQAEISNGSVTDPDVSVLVQIGTYWAQEENYNAQKLAGIALQDLFDNGYGISLSFEGDTLHEENATQQTVSAIATRRLISGIAKGEALSGSTGSAFLRRIRDKRTAAYAYFGGFVGQGTVGILLEGLPADANVSDMEMEIDAGGPFTLIINGDTCGSFTPSTTMFTPDTWDITGCNGSIVPGSPNNITITFSGDLNESYVAGGYIRVRYKTDELSDVQEEGFSLYRFPSINGIANLFDGFRTPGTVTNITAYLHFETEYPTYLTIGSRRVYGTEQTGERTVTLTDTNFTGFPALLDYDEISNATVPIRFASYNDTMQEIIGSNADVILITDISGSMKWRLDEDWVNGNKRSCSNPDIYHLNNTERLQIAQCLDITFTEIIMNESLDNNSNREWLVTFSNDADYFSSDPLDLTLDNLVDEIETYKNPSGGTCIACALNLAYNILDTYSNENRSKFVVLMTDGIPTWCTDEWWFCDANGEGISGTYNPWGCVGTSNDCDSGDCTGPVTAAVNAGERLSDDLNASIYTIGIGPVTVGGCNAADYLLSTIANESNGSYYASQDASILPIIYRDIASDILLRSGQKSQFVVVRNGTAPSILYGDSYINITYVPTVEQVVPNELSLTYQSPPFGSCTPEVMVYDGLRVIDAQMTSYSDYHWTRTVSVNGNTAYNLTTFGSNYLNLGDPYTVSILPEYLQSGLNDFVITTGDNPNNDTGCSDENSLIMTVGINISTTRSGVLSKQEGCSWDIEFEDGETSSVVIPSSYTGNNTCSYTNASITYDPTDVYQQPVFDLLRSVDFDRDGRVLINFEADDLEIIVTIVSQVPYLWGPSVAEVVVSR